MNEKKRSNNKQRKKKIYGNTWEKKITGDLSVHN